MTPTGQGALSGLRDLDCSRLIAGPYRGMLLGGLGADVARTRGSEHIAALREGGVVT